MIQQDDNTSVINCYRLSPCRNVTVLAMTMQQKQATQHNCNISLLSFAKYHTPKSTSPPTV